jgi:hypothetical protein
MLLSVIVPCHNEEAVLRATHERLAGVSTLDFADKTGVKSNREEVNAVV